MSGWRHLRLDEVEPIPTEEGRLLWQPVRHPLDIGAFGINAWFGANAGDEVIEEHNEQFDGHEEVYVVLTGHATFTLGGETLDAPAGTVVFVSDPSITRQARAEAPQTRVLAIGGPRDAVYEPPAWEAERHRASGDYDAYADELAASLAKRPDHPGLLYVLAAAESLAGRGDDAIAHLRHALELRPTLADAARDNDDFTAVRDRADWPV